MVLSTVDQSSDLVHSLSEFSQAPTSEIPPDLELYLVNLSRKGVTNAPWHLVKPLIRVKLESAIDSFLIDSTVSIDDYYPRPNMENFQLGTYRHAVMSALDQFSNAPFTIQRICELALSPGKHYRRIDKYLRGLLKCLSVVSCIDPAGQKIVFDREDEDDNEEEMAASAAASSNDVGSASISNSAAARHNSGGPSVSLVQSSVSNVDSMSGDEDPLDTSGSGSSSSVVAPTSATSDADQHDGDKEPAVDNAEDVAISDATVSETAGSETELSATGVSETAENSVAEINAAAAENVQLSDVVVSVSDNDSSEVSDIHNKESNSMAIVAPSTVQDAEVNASKEHPPRMDAEAVENNPDDVVEDDDVFDGGEARANNAEQQDKKLVTDQPQD